jgi:poly [ADP-ribose] polymerase
MAETITLIFADIKGNNNKMWKATLHDDDSVISEFGRVGLGTQRKDYGKVGKVFFDKKVREKTKKGYTEAKTVDNSASSTSAATSNNLLLDIAKSQIKLGSASLERLIERLVSSNIHRITSSTQINYNTSTGVFSTPLGVVTKEGITEARDILAQMVPLVSARNHSSCVDLANKYLRIVPQNLGMRKLDVSWLFPDIAAIQKQQSVLDSLESSLDTLSSKPLKDSASTNNATYEKVFGASLNICGDDKVRARLVKWFESTKKPMHGYGSAKVAEIYEVDVVDYNAEFISDPNTVEVFHGTSQANVLSVLKSGLLISPPSTAVIAGKLFGNGLYGSQTSTKSLGYALGRWGASVGDAGWLFVCNFAMGKAYYPTTYGISSVPAGFDSCWALPEKTRLHNDELIVYSKNRIRMNYLLEVKA